MTDQIIQIDETKCVVCYENININSSLICDHDLCLDRLNKLKQSELEFKCPICRKTIESKRQEIK